MADYPKYRIWRCVNFPSAPKYYEVPSPKDGAKKIVALAKKDLKNPNVGSNAFGLEVCERGDKWSEWYDEDGEDIDSWVDAYWGEVD